MESLGLGSSSEQLRRTALFFLGWTMLQLGSERLAPKSLSSAEKSKFSKLCVQLCHAVSTSVISSYIIATPEEDPAVTEDHLYGFSDRINLLFAHSCAYFLWDTYCELSKKKANFGFIGHGIACFLCYLFGQYPFLHFYGVRFLQFELSSPFLNIVGLFRLLRLERHPFYKYLQGTFGLTFLVVRIIYGFPLSYHFFQETIRLLQNGSAHNFGVLGYYMVSNLALNALNLTWLVLMIGKFKPEKS